MLTVKNLTKRYRQKTVMDNISLNIEKQKLISIIGANGAGKSTLLSLITQLIKPDNGEVIIDGKLISEYSRDVLAKKISMLRQSNNINLKITVRELVEFGRFPYSKGKLTPQDKQQVDKALSYMGLEALADEYLDQISGGERQRAFIAMIVAQNTDYILLDEPLNNLDMKYSVQIMKTLRNMVDNLGKTIIIVIHDINFASCYSDEIIALRGGALVSHDTTDRIIENEMLQKIYDMDIKVNVFNDQRLCNYFRV